MLEDLIRRRVRASLSSSAASVLFAFRDVVVEDNDAANRAIRLMPRADFPADPLGPAAGAEKRLLVAFFDRARQTTLVNLPPAPGNIRHDLVMAATDDGLAREMVVLQPALAGHEIFHVAVEHGDRRRAVLRVESKLILSLAQRRLHPLAGRDVGREFAVRLRQLPRLLAPACE